MSCVNIVNRGPSRSVFFAVPGEESKTLKGVISSDKDISEDDEDGTFGEIGRQFGESGKVT